MTTFKTMVKVALAAILLFGINGWINLSLMKPIEGGTEPFQVFRRHLDDAAFVLLFVFVAVVFWAMFIVLPRERGYLVLGTISLLTSLQLFWDWEEKSLLFGAFPDVPHGSLAIKSLITFLIFSYVASYLQTANKPIARALIRAGGLLWAAIMSALILSASDFSFHILEGLFLIHVFFTMSLFISQIISLLRREEHREEFRRIAAGFFLFSLVLLPDPVKDVWEAVMGRNIGYRMAYWEECLEDTFPWALLALLTVFGVVFFHRFIQTMKDIKTVSDELRSKNAALAQEVDTRQRLDQLLSVLLRTYRVADLEQSVVREGQRFFKPNDFALVKYDTASGAVGFEGIDGPSSRERDIGETLRSRSNRTISGEAILTPRVVLGAAGGTDETRLFLAVYAADGDPISLEERDKFALLLMSKYVSIFYEYFQLLESRLKEMEQKQTERAPWLSKLFMQIAEKERKRLASDLHDEALQELLHIRRLLDRTPAERWMQEDKEQIRLAVDNAEFVIRETCHELIPPFLSEHGVLQAVSHLVEKTRLRADFQLDFRALPITAPLSDEQTTAIYRIVQELINNAVKHSDAGRVTLEIGQEEWVLHIRYADDGKGMETDVALSSSRLGIRGISERVLMLGGDISMQSALGQGTKVRCSLPI
ncbi:sensor histidine kinase [Cohnella sp. REN36]|uniref:sensor histidine kinase n=1 Tax=Cohnella sp. REN36 TaxID=2887347 RepID=UPI001D14014D|nr:ATP-binding protein [Cohnella sp. REN36]MCC3372137.1 histidine kinase [Cohnella sp. REN36]